MAEEKTAAGLGEHEPRAVRSKKYVLLTSWASVSTALLLMVIVGGAFYTAELRSRCDEDEMFGEYTHKEFHQTCLDTEETEDFHLDNRSRTELMVKRNKDGYITLITARDYRKKISASYVPASDMCFLLAGEDMDWTEKWDHGQNVSAHIEEKKLIERDLTVNVNDTVTGLSLIPDPLRTFCEGKPVYWAQPTTENQLEHTRQKRQDVTVTVTVAEVTVTEYYNLGGGLWLEIKYIVRVVIIEIEIDE